MKKLGFALVVLTLVLGLFACVSSSGSNGQRAIGSEQNEESHVQFKIQTDKFQVEVYPQMGHSRWVNAVSFSPDRKHILSGSTDRTIKLWDIETGREIKSFLGHSDYIHAISFSPDGKYVLSGSGDRTVKLWDITTGNNIKTFSGHSRAVSSISISPDGLQLLSGSYDRTIKLWDISKGCELKTFSGHTGIINSVSFSPDGKLALSGSDDKTVKLWDISTGKEVRTLLGHSDWVNSISFSPDGKLALSGSDDKTIKLWDITTGNEIRTFTVNSGNVRSVCFSPDGLHILSGIGYPFNRYEDIILWEIATGREIRSFSGHTDNVRSICLSPDGLQVLSGSVDRTIKLWDIATGHEIKTFSGHTEWVTSISSSPDGLQILSGSVNKTITLWDITIGSVIKTFSEHTGEIKSISFSPDGSKILSGLGYPFNKDETIKLWDVTTGQEIRTFSGHTGQIRSVNISPDGLQILSGSDDRTVKLWDITNGQEIKTFSGHTGSVCSVRFSQNGLHILSGSLDATIKLWDITTGQEIRTFSGHTRGINSIDLSPDGSKVLSGSNDTTIKLWDIATGREIKTFTGHTNLGLIESVCFSPDGKHVLSGAWDGIKLWDIDTGKEIKTFSEHTGLVTSVRFTPCGKHILSASSDGTTRIWDIATGIEIASFFSFNDGEWIVITPDGYYNSSPKGDQHLNVRIGNEVYGMHQFAGAFYQPEVVQARLQNLPDPPIIKERGSIQTASIPPVVRATSGKVDPITRQVKLFITATDWIRQINNIEIIINGRRIGGEEIQNASLINLLPTRAQFTPANNNMHFEITILLQLDPGANHIEIVASNGHNFGLRPLFLTTPTSEEQKKGDLWVLAVGIDKYINNNTDSGYMDLRNPSTDARRIIGSFMAQEGKRYDKVHTLCIADNELNLPTKRVILENMNEFFQRVKEYDTVVLFMSGHGKTEKNENGDGIYYFMPRDTVFLGDEKFALDSVISVNELSEALNIPGRKIVMLDTCESGGVDSIRLAHSLRNRSTVVFTASQEGEFALDTTLYGGLLAYSVAEGVTGKAATEGTVQIEPLGKHVIQQVRELSRDRQSGVVRQTPVVYYPDWYKNFEIAW